MKHLLRLSLLLITVALFQPTQAFVAPYSVPATSNTEVKPSPFAGMTIKDFLALTPKKYKELTGKKLTLPQKVSLKLAQKKVKRMVRKGQTVDLMQMTSAVDTSDFSIGGLVLGLVLGIIGVLIAYLIGDQSVIKWSWIGFAIWVGIVLLVLIL
jgi:hypothetical protein